MTRVKLLLAGAVAVIASLAVHSAAQADTIAFVESSGGDFSTQDLNTGILTLVGTNSSGIVGLGQIGGTLYAANGSTLYSVNTGTGALTSLGSSSTGTTFVDFGSTTSGLFAIGANGDLYSISGLGAATQVGTGLGLGSSLVRSTGSFPNQTVVLGLSTGSGTLFLVDNNVLYDINTTTGVAAQVGGDGTLSQTDIGIGALLVDPNGAFWGGANEGGPGANSDTELLTGAGPITVTKVATTHPANQHGFQYMGLAFDEFATSAVPEPAQWALMLTGFAGLGAMARRRRRLGLA